MLEALKVGLRKSPAYAEELLSNYNSYYCEKSVRGLKKLTYLIDVNTNDWNPKYRSYFYMWYVDKLIDIIDKEKRKNLQRLQQAA